MSIVGEWDWHLFGLGFSIDRNGLTVLIGWLAVEVQW